jgi:hypothetical protein
MVKGRKEDLTRMRQTLAEAICQLLGEGERPERKAAGTLHLGSFPKYNFIRAKMAASNFRRHPVRGWDDYHSIQFIQGKSTSELTVLRAHIARSFSLFQVLPYCLPKSRSIHASDSPILMGIVGITLNIAAYV